MAMAQRRVIEHEVLNLREVGAALDRATEELKRRALIRQESAAVMTLLRATRGYPAPGTRHSVTDRQGRQRRWTNTGNLQRSVIRGAAGRYAVSAGGTPLTVAPVKVLAPHVHLYEQGTADRVFNGAARGRVTGIYQRTPERTFIGIAMQERGTMIHDIQALLDRTIEI